MAIDNIYNLSTQTPELSPSLWNIIEYKDENRIIYSEPGLGQIFVLNEIGSWNNKLYKSLINFNIKTPDESPESWEEYEV